MQHEIQHKIKKAPKYGAFKLPQTGIEPVRVSLPTGFLVPGVCQFRHYGIFIINGTYRARTCDPLLVRQMLSQLS